MSPPPTPESFVDELALLHLGISRLSIADIAARCADLDYVASKILARASDSEVETIRKSAYTLRTIARLKARTRRRAGYFFAVAGAVIGVPPTLLDRSVPGSTLSLLLLGIVAATVLITGLGSAYEANEWTVEVVPLADNIFNKAEARASEIEHQRRGPGYRDSARPPDMQSAAAPPAQSTRFDVDGSASPEALDEGDQELHVEAALQREVK